MQDSTNIIRLPRSNATVGIYTFEDQGDVPNNRDLPVLVMRGVISASATATAIRALLEGNNWGGTWQWTVFDFHHYHPNAHEALVIASGRADLVLGGPGGETFRVDVGDVLVLPAGTGHFRADATANFQVCGAYPAGQENYDTLRVGDPRPPDLLARIARVPLPRTDPIYGADGPLTTLWPNRR